MRSLRTHLKTNFHFRSRCLMQRYAQGSARSPGLFDSPCCHLWPVERLAMSSRIDEPFKGRPVPEQWLVYVSICVGTGSLENLTHTGEPASWDHVLVEQGVVRPDEADGESAPSSTPSWCIHSEDLPQVCSENTEL